MHLAQLQYGNQTLQRVRESCPQNTSIRVNYMNKITYGENDILSESNKWNKCCQISQIHYKNKLSSNNLQAIKNQQLEESSGLSLKEKAKLLKAFNNTHSTLTNSTSGKLISEEEHTNSISSQNLNNSDEQNSTLSLEDSITLKNGEHGRDTLGTETQRRFQTHYAANEAADLQQHDLHAHSRLHTLTQKHTPPNSSSHTQNHSPQYQHASANALQLNIPNQLQLVNASAYDCRGHSSGLHSKQIPLNMNINLNSNRNIIPPLNLQQHSPGNKENFCINIQNMDSAASLHSRNDSQHYQCNQSPSNPHKNKTPIPLQPVIDSPEVANLSVTNIPSFEIKASQPHHYHNNTNPHLPNIDVINNKENDFERNNNNSFEKENKPQNNVENFTPYYTAHFVQNSSSKKGNYPHYICNQSFSAEQNFSIDLSKIDNTPEKVNTAHFRFNSCILDHDSSF